MINVTSSPLDPTSVVDKVRTRNVGCVVTYVGVIRNRSKGKMVQFVEYIDYDKKAADRLRQIAVDACGKWTTENIAIAHRTGRLTPGDINLIVAVAASHRKEGFAACRYVIDQFKRRLPTAKSEKYVGNIDAIDKK